MRLCLRLDDSYEDTVLIDSDMKRPVRCYLNLDRLSCNQIHSRPSSKAWPKVCRHPWSKQSSSKVPYLWLVWSPSPQWPFCMTITKLMCPMGGWVWWLSMTLTDFLSQWRMGCLGNKPPRGSKDPSKSLSQARSRLIGMVQAWTERIKQLHTVAMKSPRWVLGSGKSRERGSLTCLSK